MTDIILISSSFYVVVFFHYEGNLGFRQYEFLKFFLPWIIVLRLGAFIFVGLYQGVWKYVGFNDIFTVGNGTLVGSLFLLMMYYVRYTAYHEFMSPYFFFFEFLFTFVLIAGSRCGWRILWQAVSSLGEDKKKVIIVGTDFNGVVALKNIKENERHYDVLGFVSTNELEVGSRIQGIPIIGNIDNLAQVLSAHKCDEVICTGSHQRYEKIEETCRSYDIPIREYQFQVHALS
ncbi:MAG: hypothetical protein A3A85_03345 [Deltaproteobacteria bacterium RIFCSPLOWO2_01_FULL_42_9]|nr:MAG: hypothetical protein A3A85_03345 [Deltaproteobacteria bacterium RIFCSPLOWO2_01_FULL_42_9]